ncbi:MAG TPA: PHB depolymerase family esterase [Saprospiraceae bacterium]|nr:PHB depolymerase family esterase [Saprospiraceae bacterium]
MKYFFLGLILWTIGLQSQTITGKIVHDGLNRDYRLYIPKNFHSNKSYPLIVNLHGFTSNAQQQEIYGDFRSIADTAGFLIVHPNGTTTSPLNQSFWNVGFFPSTVDDVGFINKLIDSLSLSYPIDKNRIYATGMSNGGFMSYKLACESDKFAAIASVTGSMVAAEKLLCKRKSPIPVMEIHGTADGIVPYTGTQQFLSIDEVLNFWKEINKTESGAQVIKILDISSSDGATAEHIIFHAKDSYAPVEHFKINNGGHTWPGAVINVGTTCQDISASLEIWKFFSRFRLNSISSNEKVYTTEAKMYFSAESNELILAGSVPSELIIMDLSGRVLYSKWISKELESVNLTSINSGLYLAKLNRTLVKFVKY